VLSARHIGGRGEGVAGLREPMVRIHFPPAESRANHRFLCGGAHVDHFWGRDADRGARVVADVEASGGAADFLVAELSTFAEVRNLADAAQATAVTGGVLSFGQIAAFFGPSAFAFLLRLTGGYDSRRAGGLWVPPRRAKSSRAGRK
jgi:hypothetical protein